MRARIDRMEAEIQRDVGRDVNDIFLAARGGLWRAAEALAAAQAPRIGLITGFYVPGGDPPAAETDGPGGAALMAFGFLGAGLRCRLATDTLCESACRVALDRAGARDVPVDAVAPDETVDAVVDRWRADRVDWVVAIERCGPGADGRPRNMRGTDISVFTAPLHQLFRAGPWRTIAIGDGGNEIGMGIAPPGGTDATRCVVPADFLIAAGVSHWAAYAVLAALALLRPDWAAAMRAGLDPDLDRAVIEAIVKHGPGVDGVTLRRDQTIDGLEMGVHHELMQRIIRCD
jgi:hypothetical protein